MLNSTLLMQLVDADYEMLKEKGKEGEEVMHYNGFLDGFAQGFTLAKEIYIAKSCKYLQGVNNLHFLGMPTIDIEMFRKAMGE